MTSAVPSLDSFYNKVNGKGLETKKLKAIKYRKNLLPRSVTNTGNINNNDNAGELNLERTSACDDSNYNTLDSAYNTSDSTYNTVDSSYSLLSGSSGYSTLDLKWKARDSTNLSGPQEHSQCLSDTQTVSNNFDVQQKPFDVGDGDEIKFADDFDDTDTATETETDTEFKVSDCPIDMSYLPDYIRPVAAIPTSVTTLTSTTTSFTTCRAILSSTVTSPSMSVTSSTMTSPAASVFEESIGISPKATNYRRIDRNSSPYAGYKEDYIRKQSEKLCGRKSLEERLKSLETDASVKLEVRRGSRNRRRKSAEREMVSKIRSYQQANVTSSTGSKSPFKDTMESGVRQIDDLDKVNISAQEERIQPLSSTATPDIIESHQPSNKSLQAPSQRADPEMLVNKDEVSSNDEVAPVETISLKIRPTLNYSNPTQQQQDERSLTADNESDSDSVRRQSFSPSATNSCENSEEPTPERLEPVPCDQSNVTEVDSVDEDKPSSLKSPKVKELSLNKLPWKTPSQEALNRLTDEFEGLSLQLTNIDKASESVDVVKKPENVTEESTAVTSPVRKRIVAVPPLVLDVTTDDNAVVPVELRSPRNEGDGFSRMNMREKRNARVFVIPSSDDSETDNILARLNRSAGNRSIHAAPVKFIPSVLRRSQRRAVKDEVASLSSSTSSLATDVKATPTEEKNATTTHKEQRRKSSRSPKRSGSRRSGRSKSTHDVPNHEKSKHTRTLSSGSRSPVSVSTSSFERMTESPKERSVRKDKSGKNSRHRTEYAELSNVQRTTPRKLNDTPNMPSPRQLEVAQAVKFGFSKTEGTIPYIDDNASPDEHKERVSGVMEGVPSHDPLLSEANQATVRRAFPLSKRGRSSKRKEVPRRTSYMEAMESSDDVTPDPDTDGSYYGIVRTESGKEEIVTLGKYGRSNSADSVLSTTDVPAKVVLRKRTRASSADRNSIKGVNRRSYQIATNQPVDAALLSRTPSHKRQPSIKRLKNFFVENTQQITEPHNDETRRPSRGRSLGLTPVLTLNEYDDTVVREGFLSFKVATIEKGKRTSAQKSWKLVWVVLKEQFLYLCKDWSRNKQDSSTVTPGDPTSASPSTANHPPSQLALEEEEPLNIQGSLVSIAYNYLKRKNVFKVTTGNGSEYLFQADDREEMLAWINSVQVSGNHDNKDGEVTINEDLILRKTSQIESGPKADKRSTRKSRSPKPARRTTVPLKDVDGSRRFKWRGSVNRIVKKFGQGQTLMQGGTFDVLLEDCPPSANNDLVPFVVDLCCRIVEEKGLSFTGIYRVPGNSGTLSALEEDLNQRGADAVDLENDERFRELNVVSSLLKCFFRKLPDPLFTNELYDNFIAMNRKKDPEERLTGLRRLIHMLPAPHYETLKFLVNHLSKVSENSQANKMEIRNLAIVFGPTLVRSTAPDNVSTMVTDMSDQCRIVESVLQHASWFFSDEKLQGSLDRTQSVPSEGVHEPVPNINHLLANVGRTPGDTSDSTSESSKSKASCASEKESFSRDVMEMIFGAGKRWLQNPQRGAKENTGEESSDDEYGFKEAERNKSSRVALQRPKSPPKSPPATTSSNSRYQVSKPAASGIRAGLANRGQTQHLPLDIHARLYDFYVESLERIARTDLTRPLPYFSSSSTDTSPQVTPRTSFFGAPQPQQLVRSYPPHVRRPSDGKPYNGAFPSDGPRLHGASAPPLPRRYRPHLQDERNKDFKPFLATSTPLRSESDNQFIPVSAARSQPEVSSISKESLQGDEESDSDTSIYVGDTLEEKLKNLTNVDKKLERRPSRRHANRNHSILMKVAPTAETLKSSNKKLSAPSMQAGEKVTTDNIHMYPVKKTSRELYQQRKQQRQQHRDGVRSIRTSRKQLDPSLCASDENVFSHFDSRRQILRHPSHDDVMSCQGRRPRQIKEKIRRRHTLAGNDFPGQEFWEKGCHASLQNIARDAPGSAIARLCPQLGASAPSVAYMPSGVRVMGNSATYRPEISRKTESYL